MTSKHPLKNVNNPNVSVHWILAFDTIMSVNVIPEACYAVAAQSRLSQSLVITWQRRDSWMSASARMLCLPSIVVQLFQKYSKVRGLRQVPSPRFGPECPKGSEAKVSGGGKKSRVKKEQGQGSARLGVSRVYQGSEKYRNLL